MASFNRIIIVGYLGRDPELRQTPQGTSVCDFSVATTERRKDKAGDLQEITTWFRVTLFGRQAELAAQYLTKGQQVYVEGALSQREYTDKDGVTRTSLDVRGTEIRFLSSASEGEQLRAAAANAAAPEPKRQPAPQPKQPSRPVAVTEDDIPF
ncbi:MAG TPA: single-stranded DNA-binding protein [Blastocatellia bacterium]|nr:single-stranded DNA-binding protein [Blastocatellia bacterium]